MSKNFTIIFDGLDARQKCLHLVNNFFALNFIWQKFLLLRRDLKYGYVE